MSKCIDLTGKKFTKLTVIKRVKNNKHNHAMWLCKCDCGNTTKVSSSCLNTGNNKSCGCLNKEISSNIWKHNIKHGKCNTKIYNTWGRIIQRCTNSNHPRHKDWGGRGIKICKRWEKFENFLEDMGEPPTSMHEIDRIDNNKNYESGNCRWATKKEQGRNKRNNRLIKYKNKTKCLSEWAEELNMNYNTLHRRIYKLNWLIKDAFETQVRSNENE